MQDKIILGNLNARRDWGYTPDYVRAIWIILQHEKPDDYIIASGEEHTVREFAELAFKEIGINLHWEGEDINERGIDEDDKIRIEVSKKFFRPAEVDILKGNPSKAKKVLGWKPEVSFKEMIRRMVVNDLKLLKAKGCKTEV